MKHRPPVTVKEVADRAGVSQMTVSRVLNQPALVRLETRARVERAIKELNYRPNLLARGLAGGGSYYIGLVYMNPSRSYLSEILLGALEECRAGGSHLVIEDLAPDSGAQSHEALENRLRVSGLDGVIITPPLSESAGIIRAVRAIGMSYVLVAPRITESKSAGAFTHPTVFISDRAAAQDMTAFLIDQKHQKIGFVRGDATHISSEHRYKGFRAALKARSITQRDEYIVEGTYTFEGGYRAAKRLLALKDRPTAIFASNDDTAAGVIAYAHEQGIGIPDDLSVVGFDDTAIASAIWPPLTTIRQPIAQMAREAVALLTAMLDGSPVKSKRIELGYELIVRKSAAPPRAD